MRLSILLFCFFICFVPFFAAASNSHLPVIKGGYQLSLENVTLPGSEKMGLMGGNYLIENQFFTTGLGVYGAVTGDRGGFFTGGFHVAKSLLLINGYFIEGNLFLGGGGGGAAPQGGGLMLRAALGLTKQIGNSQYFLGVSQVSFPNGDIDSRQLSFAYTHLFKKLHFSGWRGADIDAIGERSFSRQKSDFQQISMQVMDYFPSPGVKSRAARVHEKTLSVLGVRFSRQLNHLFWSEFETAGAMSGGIDGFAQVLAGFSIRQPIFKRVSFSSGWLLGAAGGGDVDTGGGSISRIYAGLDVDIYRRWSSNLHFGYVTALGGAFSAKTVNFNVVYNFKNISLNKTRFAGSTSKVNWRRLRVRPGLQRYTFYQQPSRKSENQQDLDVDLTILKLDAFFNSHIYFSGQALGAFRGKAGGYAVGLIGPGVQLTPNISTELLFGVAGGGGIAVGSGKIIQPMVNFDLKLNHVWSSELSAGYIKAYDDKLSAFVFNVGLVYRFSQPYY